MIKIRSYLTKHLSRAFLLVSLLLMSSFSWAGQPVPFMSEKDFEELAQELSLKVDLFKFAWELNPEIEFYGGTSRDFLYWVKRQLRQSESASETAEIAAKLRSLKIIETKEFINSESDVDLASKDPVNIRAEDFGVRTIDWHSRALFDPNSPEGKNELLQGHIPAEKIRFNSKGFIRNPKFGDGLGEIYQGRITVQFADPEDFANSDYAKKHENHPILLVLRFIRLQAMDYYNSYGSGYPDRNHLLDMDSQSELAIQKVCDSVLAGRVLKPYLAQPRFRSWLNSVIRKTFRTSTNQTAALELMKYFKMDQLSIMYEGVEPINQYVFIKKYDADNVNANLERYGVNAGKFYLDVSKEFPDGYFYHGTKTNENFKNIIFQGALPSTDGAAGKGLYGVSIAYQSYAEQWAGHRDRLLAFPIKDKQSKFVDITAGEGLRIFNHYKKNFRPSGPYSDTEIFESFAEDFGVDIMAYPYEVRAFVVKNASFFGDPEGVNLKLLTFTQLSEKISEIKSFFDLIHFIKWVDLVPRGQREIKILLEELIGSFYWKNFLKEKRLSNWDEGLQLLETIPSLTERNASKTLAFHLREPFIQAIEKLNHRALSENDRKAILIAFFREDLFSHSATPLGQKILESVVQASKAPMPLKENILTDISKFYEDLAMGKRYHIGFPATSLLSLIEYYPELFVEVIDIPYIRGIFQTQYSKFLGLFQQPLVSKQIWKLATGADWWSYARIFADDKSPLPPEVFEIFASHPPSFWLKPLGVQSIHAAPFLILKIYKNPEFLKKPHAGDFLLELVEASSRYGRGDFMIGDDLMRGSRAEDSYLRSLLREIFPQTINQVAAVNLEKASDLFEAFVRFHLHWGDYEKEVFMRSMETSLADSFWQEHPLYELWMTCLKQDCTEKQYKFRKRLMLTLSFKFRSWYNKANNRCVMSMH